MANINVDCPICGMSLDAPSDFVGEMVECPGCGDSFEIPGKKKKGKKFSMNKRRPSSGGKRPGQRSNQRPKQRTSGAGRSAGGRGGAGGYQKPIKNWLMESIIVLFCCSPPAIVAIIFASQVNGKINAGDDAGARKSSNTAKTWVFVSLGLGITMHLIWILGLCAVSVAAK